jgi:hypothetical protein
MNEPISFAQAVANRRFGLLMLAFLGALGVYGLIWQQGARRLETTWADAQVQATSMGLAILAERREIQGFPFRLELHLHKVQVASPWGAYRTELVVIRGLPLRADHLVIDGGLSGRLSLVADNGWLDAQDARASLVGRGDQLRVAVDVKKLSWNVDDTDSDRPTIARAQYHTRPGATPGNREHVVRLDGISQIGPHANDGPVGGFEIMLRADGTGQAEVTGGSMQVGDRKSNLAGRIAVSPDGQLTGRITTGEPEILVEQMPQWLQGLIHLALAPTANLPPAP